MANNLIATGAINAAGFESEAPNNFAFATWRAVPFTTDGPVVFRDGSKVPTYQGQLDANGHFAAGALIGDTSQMRPPSSRFMFQIFPVATSPPITITNVEITSTTPGTLGAILSAQIAPLRIQAGPLVYAYSQEQVINPTAGSGYVNTTSNTSWLFVGSGSVGDWIEVSGGGGGGGGSPVGPNGAVQYNNSGSFGGTSGAVTDGAGNLNLTGNIQTAVLATSASSYVTGKTNITTGPSFSDIEPPSPGGTIYLGINQAGLINFAGSGSIDRSGNTHFLGTMENNGAVTFDSTLHVIGTSTLAGIHASGAVTFDSTLTVALDAAVVGNVAVGGQLAVTGTFSANHADIQSIDVHADALFQGLSIEGRGPQPTSSLTLLYDSGIAYLDSVGPSTGVRGGMHLRVYDGDGNFTLDAIIIANDGSVNIPISAKTYNAASINNVAASRAFNTAYQNTSGMSLQVCMSYTTAGSATGFVTANIGPTNPPADQVYRNENTASVAGAELAIVLTIPPGWWYEIQPGSGEITGIGRWWEWTCP